MNETIKDTLDRLKSFAQSASLAAASDVPEIQEILEGKTTLPENCPSKEAMAELVLRHTRKYLVETIAAFVDVEKFLFPESANKHVFIHTCASGNRVQGQLHFSWDRRPSEHDEIEASKWYRTFGPQECAE